MNIKLPYFTSYGNYSSDNYGVNAMMFVDAQGNEFYFSYKTLVAFRSVKDYKLVIRENAWGNTTGKHLNWIDRDKSKRMSSEEFKRLFNEAFKEE